ncbi:hypothetical protein TWF694_009253 [Orbilia ellipsospora]|uniref:F-box domain-containing protein n=1 Tax=Orbilia ellipsospora TaxID=2528407 RepID=A0AAV9XED0_9PEZI
MNSTRSETPNWDPRPDVIVFSIPLELIQQIGRHPDEDDLLALRHEINRAEVNLLFPHEGFSTGSRGIPVNCSVLLSRMSNLEAIVDSPFWNGVTLNWFKPSQRRFLILGRTLPKLKQRDLVLEFRKSWRGDEELADADLEGFRRYAEALGALLEILSISIGKIKGPECLPSILPSRLCLPFLKSLTLSNIPFLVGNLVEFLDNYTQTLEIIYLYEPGLNDPNEAWFRLLKHLRQNFSKLRRLELSLFNYLNIYSAVELYWSRYILPRELNMEGKWEADNSVCQILMGKNPEWGDMKERAEAVHWTYETQKNLAVELDTYDNATAFWNSITDGMASSS